MSGDVMTTYTQWLSEHEEDTDGTGEIARWWRDSAATRPRVHTPSGVQKFHDAQIRAGALPGTGTDNPDHMTVRGKLREQFADTVRAYQHRDDAPGADPAVTTAIIDRLASIHATIELIRRRQERIMAVMGLEAGGEPYGARTGPLELPPPAVTDYAAAGHQAALEVRARIGDQAAAAELAANRARAGAEPVSGPSAGDSTSRAAESLSGPWLGTFGAGSPHDHDPQAWQAIWEHADHIGAAQSEGEAA
jgi:hypothetical protein